MLARAVALTRRSRATQLRGRTQITFCVESRRDRPTQLPRSFADAPQHSNSGRCACVGSKALKTDLVRCFAHDAVRLGNSGERIDTGRVADAVGFQAPLTAADQEQGLGVVTGLAGK